MRDFTVELKETPAFPYTSVGSQGRIYSSLTPRIWETFLAT